MKRSNARRHAVCQAPGQKNIITEIRVGYFFLFVNTVNITAQNAYIGGMNDVSKSQHSILMQLRLACRCEISSCTIRI